MRPVLRAMSEKNGTKCVVQHKADLLLRESGTRHQGNAGGSLM